MVKLLVWPRWIKRSRRLFINLKRRYPFVFHMAVNKVLDVFLSEKDFPFKLNETDPAWLRDFVHVLFQRADMHVKKIGGFLLGI